MKTGSCHLFGKDWQVEEWNNNQLHDRWDGGLSRHARPTWLYKDKSDTTNSKVRLHKERFIVRLKTANTRPHLFRQKPTSPDNHGWRLPVFIAQQWILIPAGSWSTGCTSSEVRFNMRRRFNVLYVPLHTSGLQCATRAYDTASSKGLIRFREFPMTRVIQTE